MVSKPANSINESGASGFCNFDGTATFSTTPAIQYNVLTGASANTINNVAPSTAGQLFTSAGASAQPTWTTSTYPGTNAINTLLYANSANVMAALATANNGVLITGTSGIPSILAAGTTGQVLTATTGSPPSWSSAGTGTVTSVSGTTNQVSVATGTTTPVISLVGPYTPATYTAHGVLVGEGTSSIVSTAVGTTGQVLTGVTGSDPVWAAAPGAGLLSTGLLTWTNAALKAGTSLTLLAAQGASTYIVPVSIAMKLNYGGSNAFTSIPTAQLNFSTSTGVNIIATLPNGSMFWEATSNFYFLTSTINNSGANDNTAVSATLSIALTGNAAANNTVSIEMLYYVVAF